MQTSVSSLGGAFTPSFTSATLVEQASNNGSASLPMTGGGEPMARDGTNGSANGSGTNGMMSSAGQMLIGSIIARLVERVSYNAALNRTSPRLLTEARSTVALLVWLEIDHARER